jgi:hypothetical protein
LDLIAKQGHGQMPSGIGSVVMIDWWPANLRAFVAIWHAHIAK